MKRVVLLGGSTQQIPAIKYAKEHGYYTILCDYLPDNPGQYYAEKFYCVSTTDKEAILEVAKNEKIDGVVAYASDPAALTAAYVTEKLGLPTNPYKSVEILSLKDKFRDFLRENEFSCPKAKGFSLLENAMLEISQFTFPVMVKPIDSSGSKGVSKVEHIEEFESAFLLALNNSRAKNIIIEEFIEQDHEYMIGGDCFVLHGEVIYWGFLNCHRDLKVNALVPIGKSYPLLISEERVEQVKKEIQRVVNLLHIKFGGFNVEVMVDAKERVFLIELGPRNGGNMIPDFLKIIHGVDLIAATIEKAIGNNEFQIVQEFSTGFYVTHNLHTDKNGLFEKVQYNNGIEDKIIKEVIYKKTGDNVQYFDGADKVVGIVFLKFNTQEEQINFIENPENWIEVIIKQVI